jgi:hypothetical protein
MFGIGRNETEEEEESTLRVQKKLLKEDSDEKAFQGMMEYDRGYKDEFEENQYITEPTPLDETKKNLGLMKEMVLSKLDNSRDKELAQVKFEIVLCAITDFPDESEFIESSISNLEGFLMLRCSDKGWARELLKTRRQLLRREGGEEQKQKKLGVI